MPPQRRLALLADALAADTKFKTIKYRQGVQTTEGFTDYRGTAIRVGDKDIGKLTHAQYKVIRNQCSEVFRDSRQDGSARRLLKKHLGPLLTHFHFDWVQGQPLRNILRLIVCITEHLKDVGGRGTVLPTFQRPAARQRARAASEGQPAAASCTTTGGASATAPVAGRAGAPASEADCQGQPPPVQRGTEAPLSPCSRDLATNFKYLHAKACRRIVEDTLGSCHPSAADEALVRVVKQVAARLTVDESTAARLVNITAHDLGLPHRVPVVGVPWRVCSSRAMIIQEVKRCQANGSLYFQSTAASEYDVVYDKKAGLAQTEVRPTDFDNTVALTRHLNDKGVMIEVFSVFRIGLRRDELLQHIHGAQVNGHFKTSLHLRVALRLVGLRCDLRKCDRLALTGAWQFVRTLWLHSLGHDAPVGGRPSQVCRHCDMLRPDACQRGSSHPDALLCERCVRNLIEPYQRALNTVVDTRNDADAAQYLIGRVQAQREQAAARDAQHSNRVRVHVKPPEVLTPEARYLVGAPAPINVICRTSNVATTFNVSKHKSNGTAAHVTRAEIYHLSRPRRQCFRHATCTSATHTFTTARSTARLSK